VKTERLAKGVNLVLVAKMLRKQKLVDTLPNLLQEDRDLLNGLVLPTSWYPFDSFARIYRAFHTELMGGDTESALRMGIGIAHSLLEGPHVIYVHKGNPKRTVGNMGRIWRAYFNFGDFTAEEGELSARVRLTGYPDVTASHGMTIIGWMQGAIELSGGVNAAHKLEEAPWQGSPNMVVTMTWQSVTP